LPKASAKKIRRSKQLEREVNADRFTGLDRMLIAEQQGREFSDLRADQDMRDTFRQNRALLIERARKLERMGLATEIETGIWIVSSKAEPTPLGARDVYGISKVAGECIARAYAAHDIETVVLRPSWVYGLRRRTPCMIRTMVADALAGRVTRFDYGRGFPRQFVHVSDVAAAVVASLRTHGVAGSAFNLADGRRYELGEVASLVTHLLPKAQIVMAAGPDPDDVVCGLLDVRAALEHLRWYPKIELEAGIERMALELSEEQA
jgi:nucleoside-diphosphate-sugar epimerase